MQRIQLTSELDEDEILTNVLKSDIANLRATIDTADNATFNRVVDELFQAKKVYIVGMKSASPLAQFLGYYLGFVLDNVVTVNASFGDAYESMIRVGPEDLCVGISFPRYSSRTVEALSFAKSMGAKVVAITDGMFSPIAELADYVLLAHSDMASFADSLTAPLSLINAMIVAASMRRRDDVYDRLDQLENLWRRQKVYMGRPGHRRGNGAGSMKRIAVIGGRPGRHVGRSGSRRQRKPGHPV